MQQRPDLTRLLEAVAELLAGELAESTRDRALRFRVLIAANLVKQVAAELDAEDGLVAAELTGLAELFGEAPAAPESGRQPQRRALAEADRELARRIRDGELSPGELTRARKHLLDAYAAYLRATDPAFDRRLEIE